MTEEQRIIAFGLSRSELELLTQMGSTIPRNVEVTPIDNLHIPNWSGVVESKKVAMQRILRKTDPRYRAHLADRREKRKAKIRRGRPKRPIYASDGQQWPSRKEAAAHFGFSTSGIVMRIAINRPINCPTTGKPVRISMEPFIGNNTLDNHANRLV